MHACGQGGGWWAVMMGHGQGRVSTRAGLRVGRRVRGGRIGRASYLGCSRGHVRWALNVCEWVLYGGWQWSAWLPPVRGELVYLCRVQGGRQEGAREAP